MIGFVELRTISTSGVLCTAEEPVYVYSWNYTPNLVPPAPRSAHAQSSHSRFGCCQDAGAFPCAILPYPFILFVTNAEIGMVDAFCQTGMSSLYRLLFCTVNEAVAAKSDRL